MFDDNGKQTCDYCGSQMEVYQISPLPHGVVHYDICTDCTSEHAWGDEVPVSDENCKCCGTWTTVSTKTNLCIICTIIHDLDNR